MLPRLETWCSSALCGVFSTLVLTLALAACSARPLSPFDGPSYPLESISDPEGSRDDNRQFAYVILTPEKNYITITQLDYTFDRVDIYRKDDDNEEFRPLGTARSLPFPHPSSLILNLVDTLSTSLNSRYEFHPFAGDSALVRLRVTYATSDQAYAQQLEGQ